MDDILKKIFPNGCENYGISLDAFSEQEKFYVVRFEYGRGWYQFGDRKIDKTSDWTFCAKKHV